MKGDLLTSPPVDLRERRELNNGFGEALSRAFEFAVTPVVFGFLGHLIDMRLNTSPIFLLALAAFAVVGQFVKLWYAYDREMDQRDEGQVWAEPASTQGAPQPRTSTRTRGAAK